MKESFPRFDPSRFSFKRHDQSVTQGSYAIYFDGKEVITYGDNPQMKRDAFGAFVRDEAGRVVYEGSSEAQMLAAAKRLWERGHYYERIQPLSGWAPYVAADNDNVIELVTHEGRRLFAEVPFGAGMQNEVHVFDRDAAFEPKESNADGKYLATLRIDQAPDSPGAFPTMRDGVWFKEVGTGPDAVSLSSIEWHAMAKFVRLQQKRDHIALLRGQGWMQGNEAKVLEAYAEANRLACEVESFKDYMAMRDRIVLANYATAYHDDDSYDLPELAAAPRAFVVDCTVMPSDLTRWMADGSSEVIDPLWPGQFVALQEYNGKVFRFIEEYEFEGKSLRNPVLSPFTYRPGEPRQAGDIVTNEAGAPVVVEETAAPVREANRAACLKL